MKHGLTKRMKELYDFLKSRENDLVAPSYEEMAEAIGLASTSGIHRLVHSLKSRGYVDIIEGKRRTIKLKK